VKNGKEGIISSHLYLEKIGDKKKGRKKRKEKVFSFITKERERKERGRDRSERACLPGRKARREKRRGRYLSLVESRRKGRTRQNLSHFSKKGKEKSIDHGISIVLGGGKGGDTHEPQLHIHRERGETGGGNAQLVFQYLFYTKKKKKKREREEASP